MQGVNGGSVLRVRWFRGRLFRGDSPDVAVFVNGIFVLICFAGFHSYGLTANAARQDRCRQGVCHRPISSRPQRYGTGQAYQKARDLQVLRVRCVGWDRELVVDEAAVAVLAEVPHCWRAKVREVVTQFFQIFRAQDFSLSFIGSPGHAGHCSGFAFASPCLLATNQPQDLSNLENVAR